MLDTIGDREEGTHGCGLGRVGVRIQYQWMRAQIPAFLH